MDADEVHGVGKPSRPSQVRPRAGDGSIVAVLVITVALAGRGLLNLDAIRNFNELPAGSVGKVAFKGNAPVEGVGQIALLPIGLVHVHVLPEDSRPNGIVSFSSVPLASFVLALVTVMS